MAFFRDRAWPFFLSVLVHASIVGLLVYGVFKFGSTPKPQPQPQLAIEAEVIDEGKIQQEMQKLKDDEQRKKRELEQERQRAEELKREREVEEQRLEDLRTQREQEEEAERVRTEERKAAEAKAAEEAERKAALTKAAEAKAAAEKKRKAELDRKKAADEAKAKADREAELKRRLAEEENQAARAPLLAQYQAQIQARIQRAWIRPPTARPGVNCVVYVTQLPGGEVASVQVAECNGDEFVRQSIEAAVYRASPLPLPPDPALFERNLRLNFRPEE